MTRDLAIFILSSILIGPSLASAQEFATDWSDPPLACVEDVVPSVPSRPCPDLTKVIDIAKETLDPYIGPAELPYWKATKSRLPYCRSKEILARETAAPGTFTPATMALVNMRLKAVQKHEMKVGAIYNASRTYGVPALILTGALNQESLFAELGVSDDGDNFSCGVAQINLYEWCNWANSVSSQKKLEIGWPQAGHACVPDDRLLIKPFFEIAKTKSQTSNVDTDLFKGISLTEVVGKFPAGNAGTQQHRYEIATSFLNNCGNPANAIPAKAAELANLYRNHIPSGMKLAQRATKTPSSALRCKELGSQGAYPVHVGWLLAVGAYNAGPRVVDAMVEARALSATDLGDKTKFENMQPMDLVTSLFWGGTWNPATDKVTVKTRAGGTIDMKWKKLCIVQRHVSRVVEHVTIATNPALVHSLEIEYGSCADVPPEVRKTTNGKIPEIVPELVM